jgi:predicted Zn-dependent protease
MGLVGLLLMLLGSRLDHPSAARTPIRWVVCGVSSLLAIAMIAVVPMAITGNQSLADQADQTLESKRSQLEMARQQSKDPEGVKMLGEQLAQAGQLPADATDADKAKAAQQFIDGQLAQMDEQIQQAERQRNLAVNQRRYGGTLSAVVMAVAFVLLALASVL